MFVLPVPDPVAELVPETQPLLLYQHHEAGQRPGNKIMMMIRVSFHTGTGNIVPRLVTDLTDFFLKKIRNF